MTTAYEYEAEDRVDSVLMPRHPSTEILEAMKPMCGGSPDMAHEAYDRAVKAGQRRSESRTSTDSLLEDAARNAARNPIRGDAGRARGEDEVWQYRHPRWTNGQWITSAPTPSEELSEGEYRRLYAHPPSDAAGIERLTRERDEWEGLAEMCNGQIRDLEQDKWRIEAALAEERAKVERLEAALHDIIGNGDATGCNPQNMVNKARAALSREGADNDRA